MGMMVGDKEMFEIRGPRISARALFLYVQRAKPKSEKARQWLQAAHDALFAPAMAEINGDGDLILKNPFENPSGKLDLYVSRDAVMGIKIAMVQILKDSELTHFERTSLLTLAGNIGDGGVFRRLVEKDAPLPSENEPEPDISGM